MVPLPDPRLGTEIRETFAEPNWAQWVKLNLEMTKSDGSLLKMEMLRHEDWVLENIDYQFLDEEDLKATSLLTGANSSQFLKSLPLEAPPVPLRSFFAELQDLRSLIAELEADSVLVTISLDLPEIGVRGEAVVTGVEPCPVILPGPGKVVLTTFHHASSHLIDLYLSPQQPFGVNSQANTYLTSTSNSPAHPLTTFQTSEEALLYPQASRSSNMDPSWERIGVTGNHPIWSDDRHDYIAAMDLRVGERLKNLSGDTVYVQQKLPRPGPTPVYNLEVQDEHVYYVGANDVLAHNVGKRNNCDSTGETPSEYQHRVIGGSRATHEQWFQSDVGKYRIADGLRGDTAYDAKYITGKWNDSLYHPQTVTNPDGYNAHKRNLEQMIDYSQSFKSVIYISNSKAMLQSIRRMAKANKLNNIRTRYRK